MTTHDKEYEELYKQYKHCQTDILDGKWICPVCGKSVRERTVYGQLERENFNDNNEYEEIYDE